MFEKITEKISGSFKKLRGNNIISNENIQESLKEIRMSLLEADVNYKVVKTLISSIEEKAVGQEVIKSISPSEQFIKIFNDELIDLLGSKTEQLNIKVSPPAVIMMAGLQGSGKTTTAAKLAKYLKEKEKRSPCLVSVDIYRPAAIEQLRILSEQIKIPFIQNDSKNVVELCVSAQEHAYNNGFDTLIIDTAGRLQIDSDMISELKSIKEKIKVHETMLVIDSMIGQEAINVAKDFDQEVNIESILLTKLDGDARGGAALSAKYITGKPIKFYGFGEKLDMIDIFHPDRMASRILGMGDVVSLVEKASESIDEAEATKLTDKFKKNEFDFNDFKSAIKSMNKMGSLKSTLSMIPGLGKLSDDEQALKKADVELKRTLAIIDSMTNKERSDHALLDGSRRKRIAKGSGTSVQDINLLVKKFLQMRKMSKNMGKFKKKSKNMLNFN
ncbi:MAG: signal recognition particle protein [Thermodesulfobacteriota bacterium]|nr:MAG: signal recognition particle protein [Candidatus Dadabacteria bacterium]|tara:strand:- start:331 stop:1662 length:1332 start_codon:yes stop_codon:yes gene_type:complete